MNGWEAIDTAAGYAQRVVARADDLLGNATSAVSLLSDFQSAVDTDVEPDTFRSSLTVCVWGL